MNPINQFIQIIINLFTPPLPPQTRHDIPTQLSGPRRAVEDIPTQLGTPTWAVSFQDELGSKRLLLPLNQVRTIGRSSSNFIADWVVVCENTSSNLACVSRGKALSLKATPDGVLLENLGKTEIILRNKNRTGLQPQHPITIKSNLEIAWPVINEDKPPFTIHLRKI